MLDKKTARETIEKNLETLRHYLIFESESGQIVLNDIAEAFETHENESVLEEMEGIPHPFRGYMILGQQMVVRSLREALQMAQNPPDLDELIPTHDEQEIENDEYDENIDPDIA